jgi:hypothetical protein
MLHRERVALRQQEKMMAENKPFEIPPPGPGASRKEHRPGAKVLRSMDGGYIPSDEYVVVYACRGDGARVRQPEGASDQVCQG